MSKRQSKTKLTVHSWNAQSVGIDSRKTKVPGIRNHVVENDVDVLLLTETWIKDGQDTSVLILDGYDFIHIPRRSETVTRGGGVGILYKLSSLQLKQYETTAKFEHVCAIDMDRNLCFVVIYQPRSRIKADLLNEFLEEFTDLVKEISQQGYKVFIYGDFNFHMERSTYQETKGLNDALSNAGLVQHINVETHERGGTLDLLISSEDDYLVHDLTVDVVGHNNLRSDHYFIKCHLIPMGPYLDNPRELLAANKNLQEYWIKQDKHVFSDVERVLQHNCRELGLEYHGQTPGDGNCFYHAVSDQLDILGLDPQSPADLREAVVAFMQENPTFQGHDGEMVNLRDPVDDWNAYCDTMAQDGEWADHVILTATARYLRRDIRVVTSSPEGQGGQEHWISGGAPFTGNPIMLGHISEIHYQSLQTASDQPTRNQDIKKSVKEETKEITPKDQRSNKFKQFVDTESIVDKDITNVPGIGKVSGEKFREAGIKKVEHLFEAFKQTDRDLFVKLLKYIGNVRSHRAYEAHDSLQERTERQKKREEEQMAMQPQAGGAVGGVLNTQPGGQVPLPPGPSPISQGVGQAAVPAPQHSSSLPQQPTPLIGAAITTTANTKQGNLPVPAVMGQPATQQPSSLQQQPALPTGAAMSNTANTNQGSSPTSVPDSSADEIASSLAGFTLSDSDNDGVVHSASTSSAVQIPPTTTSHTNGGSQN